MIGKNIKFLRKINSLSQEEFAGIFGVSRQSVAKWENGESVPDISKCAEISDYFEIGLDCLVRVSLEEQKVNEETNNGKFIFGIVKVGERGNIVIPKYAREVFCIQPGDRLIVFGDVNKGGIALAKVSLGKIFGKE